MKRHSLKLKDLLIRGNYPDFLSKLVLLAGANYRTYQHYPWQEETKRRKRTKSVEKAHGNCSTH